MGQIIDRVMHIEQRSDGRWIIIHAGREIFEDFETEVEAERWADHNIDDQVYCEPNQFSAPLRYRSVSVQ